MSGMQMSDPGDIRGQLRWDVITQALSEQNLSIPIEAVDSLRSNVFAAQILDDPRRRTDRDDTMLYAPEAESEVPSSEAVSADDGESTGLSFDEAGEPRLSSRELTRLHSATEELVQKLEQAGDIEALSFMDFLREHVCPLWPFCE